MGLNVAYLTKFIIAVLGLVFYCEFLIYYLVLLQCWWPQLDPNRIDHTIHLRQDEQPVRALLLADTHLLGSRKGHWFDKLRSEKEFAYYVNRFNDLFRVSEGSQMFVVVGNHDVGFHYGISPYLHERFSSAFDAQSVRLVSVKGNHFVLVNSMAMEGRLKCTKGVGRCDRGMDLSQYSRPILLQHFPMYRESDAECNEPDQAPEDEKTQKFRERWECLSKESSDQLFDILKPRLIVTGHTHHGCHRIHREDIHEWTLPSFSWRNKDNPSFMLAVFTPNNYAVSKCPMPQESTVIWLYLLGTVLIIMWITLTYRRMCRRSRWFKTN
ncbi:Metallophosphoesterase 1 [Blattella germanica]|nr:Metallophosphoesterase 1 [Blattella germanica]